MLSYDLARELTKRPSNLVVTARVRDKDGTKKKFSVVGVNSVRSGEIELLCAEIEELEDVEKKRTYGYLISLIEDEKLRVLKRKKKDWILGNIACARRTGQITDAQAVELVAKLEGRKEGDNE